MNKLILPGKAPSVNHMYHNRMVRGRRIKVKTDEAEAWFTDTIIRASDWRRSNQWSTATGKVIVRLWFYFPDARRRDTHNALKAIMDALEDAGIYKDDKTALPRIMDYEVDRKNPRIEIEFEKVM